MDARPTRCTIPTCSRPLRKPKDFATGRCRYCRELNAALDRLRR